MHEEMVVVCPFVMEGPPDFLKVVLVRKSKPEWQKGKLNFPGGHVEPGEEPVGAAERELKEETNLEVDEMIPVGIFGDHRTWTVYVFTGKVINIEALQRGKERVELLSVWDALARAHIIASLRYLIPECMKRMDNYREDWTGVIGDCLSKGIKK